MPELEHDDLPLFPGEPGEGGDRGALGLGLSRVGLEPPGGFEFAQQAAPEAAAMVQGTVAERANDIEARLAGRGAELEQGAEGVMQDVLGLGMAEAQRPTVEENLSGAGVINVSGPVVGMVPVRLHFSQ